MENISKAGCTSFSPTELQKALVKYCQERDYQCSIVEACKGVGVSRQSYYNWIEVDGFSEWWITEAERHFGRKLPRVLAAVYGVAVGGKLGLPGSSVDRKTFLERFDKGYAPKSKTELSGDVGLTINLGFTERKESP